jgi:predicted nucleic acid-binding protein
MRRYLIDTSILAALLFDRPGAVRLVTPWIWQKEAATSILVYGEVVEYIMDYPDYDHLLEGLTALLDGIYTLYLTPRIVRRYAAVRRALRPRNQLIGDVDTLIAATALERNLTVVTMDQHFQRVPDLSVRLVTRANIG